MVWSVIYEELINSHYTLSNNFVTLNAYMCIELAHALIVYIFTQHKVLPDSGFLPWMLGSQSCEKTFRAASSMSSMFSTVINFGMLGLLHRLHRIQVQICLEIELQVSGIKYPHVEAHRAKDGNGQPIFQSVRGISNNEIAEAVEAAKQEAKEQTKYLGMFELLKEHWDNPLTPLVLEEVELVEDDEQEIDEQEDDVNARDDMKSEFLLEATSVHESATVKSGISDLYNAGISTNEENEILISLHQSVLRKVP